MAGMRTSPLPHAPHLTADPEDHRDQDKSPELPTGRLVVGDLISTTSSTVKRDDEVTATGSGSELTEPGRVLCVVVCGAGPAGDVATLVKLGQARGWTVQLVATPSALPFLDTVELKGLTGTAVRSTYLAPGQHRSQRAEAVVVAPATYNTISKCALGISDTYALGVLAEAIGMPIPVVMLPFVNSALAVRRPFERSVVQLRHEGVRVLLGDGGIEPHLPGAGAEHFKSFPWVLALDELDRLDQDR
jgi:Flavoprotein